MKIISKWKDYYDYIPHLYGGPDYRIVYNRNLEVHIDRSNWDRSKLLELPYNPFRHKDYTYSLKWLSFCGRYYLLVSRELSSVKYDYRNIEEFNKWKILNEKDHGMIFHKIFQKSTRWWKEKYEKYDDLINVKNSYLDVMSKNIKMPVFVIDPNNCDVPNLSELGLPAFVSAEQAYQDISFYIANVINDNADMNPPVDVSDKDKIVQHGFDFKQSFRHRK